MTVVGLSVALFDGLGIYQKTFTVSIAVAPNAALC